MDKVAYRYDPDNRIFKGPVVIQESPLEPGTWLWPPNVTNIEPPIPSSGLERMFLNGEWSYFAEATPPEPLPETDEERRSGMIVSRFQALGAMLGAGILPQVETYFSSGSTNALQKLAWKEASEFYRMSPLVISAGAALGLTDKQLDDLFIAAREIVI